MDRRGGTHELADEPREGVCARAQPAVREAVCPEREADRYIGVAEVREQVVELEVLDLWIPEPVIDVLVRWDRGEMKYKRGRTWK